MVNKKCALCDNYVLRPWHIVCPGCFEEYGEYLQEYYENKDDHWLSVLIQAEQRQWEVSIEDEKLRQNPDGKKVRPYKRLTKFDKKAIRKMRRMGFNPKLIAELLKLNRRTVQAYIYGNKTKSKSS